MDRSEATCPKGEQARRSLLTRAESSLIFDETKTSKVATLENAVIIDL